MRFDGKEIAMSGNRILNVLSRAALPLCVALMGCDGSFVDNGPAVTYGTLDTAGGDVAIHGFSLHVPAGAVNHPTTFVVHHLGTVPEAASEVYRLDPAGLVFAVAGTTISVDLTDPAAVTTDLLVAARDLATWVPLHPKTETPGTITGPAATTGTFAVVSCPVPHGCPAASGP
jgi:hypothetical protein